MVTSDEKRITLRHITWRPRRNVRRNVRCTGSRSTSTVTCVLRIISVLVVVAATAFGLTCSALAADRHATRPSATEVGVAQDRSVVGFVTGRGGPTLDEQFSRVAEELRRTFVVRDVRLSEGVSALNGVDVIVVAGGLDVPDAELYELDQFFMQGGCVAFLLDAAVIPRRPDVGQALNGGTAAES